MTNIARKRFRNKNLLIGIVVVFISIVISYLINSDLLSQIVYCIKNSQKGDLLKDIRVQAEMAGCWEIAMMNGMEYLYYFFPIFPIFTVLPFYAEINSYYKFGGNRFNYRRKEIIKGIFEYGIMGGLCIFIGVLIYLLLCNYFCYSVFDSVAAFSDILPADFYGKNTFGFYLIMDAVIYFVLGFLFAVMSCGALICFNNIISGIIFPLFIYLILPYVGIIFNLGNLFNFGTCISMFCNEYQSFWHCMKPCLPAIIIDLILIIVGIKNNEKIVC